MKQPLSDYYWYSTERSDLYGTRDKVTARQIQTKLKADPKYTRVSVRLSHPKGVVRYYIITATTKTKRNAAKETLRLRRQGK